MTNLTELLGFFWNTLGYSATVRDGVNPVKIRLMAAITAPHLLYVQLK